MGALAVAEGPAPPGHNKPPLTPFEAHTAHIDDLYAEAKNWLDGSAIESQAQHDALETLLDMIRDAETAADASRKEEKEPLDKQIADIQDRYNPLIGTLKNAPGKTTRAKAACLAALTVWRNAREAERQAELARLEKIAADQREAAAKALRDASAGSDLEAVEVAEAMVTEAAQTTRAATRLASASTGLRTSWVATMIDPGAALRHYVATRRTEVLAFLQGLADADVRGPIRQVPGFDVKPDRKAR